MRINRTQALVLGFGLAAWLGLIAIWSTPAAPGAPPKQRLKGDFKAKADAIAA